MSAKQALKLAACCYFWRALAREGPMTHLDIVERFGVRWRQIDSLLLKCDNSGFLLSENGGRVSAWRVVGR